MIHSRNRIHLCIAAGFAAVSLAGCGPKDSTPNAGAPSASTPAATKAPFVVGYNQWIGFVGVFTAVDKGYFKDAGLDVQMKQFSGPADSIPPLMTGHLDAALTTADTSLLLSRNTDESRLSNVYVVDTSNGADGVVAQKEIASVKDLKGKTVAATKGQVNEFLLLKALAANGLTENDVTITNMDADTSGAAVVAHKIPAAVTWEPWLTKAGSAGAHVIFSSKEIPDTILDVLTTTPKTLQDRPADVKAFVAAVAKGADYANAHPDEAALVAAKYLGSTAADAKGMLGKVKVFTAADNHRLIGAAGAPGPVFKTVTDIGDFFVAHKALDAKPDTSKAFTPDYLP